MAKLARRLLASLLLAALLTTAATPARALPLLVLGAARAVAVTDLLFIGASAAGVRAVAAGTPMAAADTPTAAPRAVPRALGPVLAGAASAPLAVQAAIVGNHTALIGGMLVPVVAAARAIGD